MPKIDLEAMKNVDITTVKRSELVDISDVKIDISKPKNERILDYIRQIKNPYCFKYGNTIIKNTYPKTDVTFTDRFKQILSGM